MLEFFYTDVGKVALVGTIAVAGQLTVTLIAWIKEVWFAADKRQREAEYLAMRLVLTLDELVGACYNAVHDPLREDEEKASPKQQRSIPHSHCHQMVTIRHFLAP